MRRNSIGMVVLASLLALPAMAQEKDQASIPEGMTFGIGAGYSFPGNILTPDTVSVRLKMGALTIEPIVTLRGASGSASATSVFESGGTTVTNEAEDTASGYDLGLGAQVHYALGTRGNFEFAVIGGLGFGMANSVENADVQLENEIDRTTINATSVGLSWGLGMQWFVSKVFSISAEATNPLVSWGTATNERYLEQPDGAGGVERRTITTKSSGANYGLVFDPTVRLLFHLYF